VRRLGAAAGYGGVGLVASSVALYGLLFAQAHVARRTIGNAVGRPPTPSGWYGHGRPGPAVRIALLGDSSAAGYGVAHVRETPGAILASGVAEAADRRVHLVSVAAVGAQSKDLQAQVERVLERAPHVAVIFIGANDVTHAVPPRTSARLLAAALDRLRGAGVEVVVATCPDLGTIEPLAPPLRQLARSWSRRLAAAQATVTVEAGGLAVALASVLTPEFTRLSEVLFGPDRFHPSAQGYGRMAAVVLPTVLAALGLTPEVGPEYGRGEALLPLDVAVVEASRHAGASVEPVGEPVREPAGEPFGRRGRSVLLRRRRRRPDAEVEQPWAEETPDAG